MDVVKSQISYFTVFPCTVGERRIYTVYGVDSWGTNITNEGMTFAPWPTTRDCTADEMVALGRAWLGAVALCNRLNDIRKARLGWLDTVSAALPLEEDFDYDEEICDVDHDERYFGNL